MESTTNCTCDNKHEPPPHLHPQHPSGSSRCTSTKHLISPSETLEAGDSFFMIIHVSTNQIIPPPSPLVKVIYLYSLAYQVWVIITNLSKFHIYNVVYYFLSGLLHKYNRLSVSQNWFKYILFNAYTATLSIHLLMVSGIFHSYL